MLGTSFSAFGPPLRGDAAASDAGGGAVRNGESLQQGSRSQLQLRADGANDSEAGGTESAVGAIVAVTETLVLHFDGDSEVDGLEVEPWICENFDYFARLSHGGFCESERGEARLPCRRVVFENFVMLARGRLLPAAIELSMRMQVLRFADMVSAKDIVQQLADSIRYDYLQDGDGVRDSAVSVLCELADLLKPAETSADPMVPTASSPMRTSQTSQAAPSPAAVWLVAASAVTPVATTTTTTSIPATTQNTGESSSSGDPLVELREACLMALPPWTRQRFVERPQLWRLDLQDVLHVYGAEASPRAESSWLALHAVRRMTKDILPFASVDNATAKQLFEERPEMVVRRCVSLCIRELPFSKVVSGFGGTAYQIQVALSPGKSGGWVLGVGGQGLCALRKVELEIESTESGTTRHELEFTGLMEHASGRQEDAVLGFASDLQQTPLPFSARLTIYEYPVHLAVQTYIGLNFNTMAMLCQGFEFGPMDLACVMDLWLQSDQLRRVPEADISEVVRRTLKFVKLDWAPVVRVSFVVCMHSCWMQAGQIWWHESLIRSCLELEVWRGPADGEPGAGTFRSYIAQIVQHALAPYPEMFIKSLQQFVQQFPPVTLESIDNFFPKPDSMSDPVSIVARHYRDLLTAEVELSKQSPPCSNVGVDLLEALLDGFKRLVGAPLEKSSPRIALVAFLSLMALCDLRHQRRLCAENLPSLLALEGRPPDGPVARFWAGCFFTLLEFSRTLESLSAQGGKVCSPSARP